MITPHVVLISGSLRAGSTSDKVAVWCAEQFMDRGATTRVFTGAELQFPFYRAGLSETKQQIRDFLDALAGADGVVLVSPTYHGTVSGLLKNALDYANDLVAPRAYLDGLPVGCVAVGAGAQGTASTLATLRTVSHALRAWPTPLGVALRTTDDLTDDGSAAQRQCRAQMLEMISQVLSLSAATAARRPCPRTPCPQATENTPVPTGGIA